MINPTLPAQRRSVAARGLRVRRDLIIAAGLCAACAIGVAVVAASGVGMHADARLLDVLAAGRHTTLWRWSFRLNGGLIPLATLTGLSAGALAFVRRGPRGAAAVAAMTCLAIVVGQLLKALQPVPLRSLGGPNAAVDSWPSGHAVVLGAVACSVVYVTRGRARFRVAAVAGLCLLLSGLSLLITRAHRPSDLVGGWLVAGFAGAAVLAFSSGRTRDQAE